MAEEKMHNPEDFIDVPAPTHGKDVYYRVCYGTVIWPNKEEHKAIFTVMSYPDRINYRSVAHMITTPSNANSLSEFDQVLAAMQKLRDRYCK